MVPPKWGGGRGGPLSAEGFRYVSSHDDHGHPTARIVYVPVGLSMLRAMPGLARGHLRTVHAHGHPYDMHVDTSTATADDLAAVVLARLTEGPVPTAFTSDHHT